MKLAAKSDSMCCTKSPVTWIIVVNRQNSLIIKSSPSLLSWYCYELHDRTTRIEMSNLTNSILKVILTTHCVRQYLFRARACSWYSKDLYARISSCISWSMTKIYRKCMHICGFVDICVFWFRIMLICCMSASRHEATSSINTWRSESRHLFFVFLSVLNKSVGTE